MDKDDVLYPRALWRLPLRYGVEPLGLTVVLLVSSLAYALVSISPGGFLLPLLAFFVPIVFLRAFLARLNSRDSRMLEAYKFALANRFKRLVPKEPYTIKLVDQGGVKEEDLKMWSRYEEHLTDNVLLCDDNTLIAMFRVRPVDSQSVTADQLRVYRDRASEALRVLGTGFALYTNVVRRESYDYAPPSETHYPNFFGYLIDNEVRRRYTKPAEGDGGFCLENELYYSITYTPSKLGKQAVNKLVFAKEKVEDQFEESLNYFEGELDKFISLITSGSRLAVIRLGMQEKKGDFGDQIAYSEMIGVLRGFVQGSFNPVPYFDGVDPTEQIFGTGVDIGSSELVTSAGDRFKTVVVHGFPYYLPIQAMQVVSNLPFEVNWSTRYVGLDQLDAKSIIGGTYRSAVEQSKIDPFKKFVSADWASSRKSEASEEDQVVLAEYEAEAERGRVGFGFTTSTIIVRGENVKEVDTRAALVRKHLENIGLQVTVEDLVCADVFFATLPGNHHRNVGHKIQKTGTEDSPKPMIERARTRQHLGTTVHASSIIPMIGVWPGERHHPSPMYEAKSPPFMYCDTIGRTPSRWSTFKDDLGHTLVLGKTGSGKSVLLNMFAVMQLKYRDAKVIVLDKDYSFYMTTHLMGGVHFDLVEGTGPLAPQFCPLEFVEEESERAWLAGWFEMIALMSGIKLETEDKRSIREMLNMAATTGVRQLSALLNVAGLPTHLTEAFRVYTSSGGALGALLDGDGSSSLLSVKDAPMITLEMGKYFKMDSVSDVTVPISHYLFHFFERLMDGRPTLMIVDEGHNLLRNSANTAGRFDYGTMLEKLLLEMRKRNAYLVFATQNLAAIAEATKTMKVALLQSTATRVFLADDTAMSSASQELYASIGLTIEDMETIAAARQKGDMYVMKSSVEQSEEVGEGVPIRRVERFSMTPLMLSMVGVTQYKTVVQHIKPLVAKYRDQPEGMHGVVRDFLIQQGVIENDAQYKEIVRQTAEYLQDADEDAGYFNRNWKEEFQYEAN